jgi:hypothetical protein
VRNHGWALRQGDGHLLDIAVGPGQPSAVLAEVLLPRADEELLDELAGTAAVMRPSSLPEDGARQSR